jgi:poly(3-hydroxybutyrate) depolymerase
MNHHTRFGRVVAATLLLLTLTTRGAAGADAKDFESREYKDGDGNLLLYRLFKPKDYDPGKKYPLILFLHGAGERGNNNTAQVRDALYWARDSVQRQQAAFVLAPQCPGTRQAFAVYGTGKQFDQSFNDYGKGAAGEWKAYKIALAKLPTGQKHYLSLINSSDAKAATRASAEFRNIRVYEDGAAAAPPALNLEKLVFARKEGNGTAKKSENDGSTIALDGDIRLKAALEYTVTAKTVLEFEFRSTAQGTAHAIGLDSDDFFDYRWANMDWAAKKGSAGKEPSTPLRLTLEVLGQLRKEFSLDERRLYITGLSMGGYGTWDAIERHPALFAAAVPVCGGGDEALAARIKDIPIWCFHGGADNVVPVGRSRNMIEAIKAAGGKPKYTEYPGVGHNSWDKAYSEPELAGWLFAQRRD